MRGGEGEREMHHGNEACGEKGMRSIATWYKEKENATKPSANLSP